MRQTVEKIIQIMGNERNYGILSTIINYYLTLFDDDCYVMSSDPIYYLLLSRVLPWLGPTVEEIEEMKRIGIEKDVSNKQFS